MNRPLRGGGKLVADNIKVIFFNDNNFILT